MCRAAALKQMKLIDLARSADLRAARVTNVPLKYSGVESSSGNERERIERVSQAPNEAKALVHIHRDRLGVQTCRGDTHNQCTYIGVADASDRPSSASR